VYRIVSNELFQVTNTPTVSEVLNDITVLADGSVRLVWSTGGAESDVMATTFTLPPVPSTCANRTVTLTATTTYAPKKYFYGTATMVPQMTFAIPATIPVTSGNLGSGFATLAFKTATCQNAVRCRYVSNGNNAYKFAGCSRPDVTLGTLVTATDVRLRDNLVRPRAPQR
jgi:hypothetical protein